MRKLHLGIAGLLAGLVLGGLMFGGYLPSQAQPSFNDIRSGEVTLCVNKKSKQVTFRKSCRASEKSLVVGAGGPQGLQGSAGPAGAGGDSISSFPLLSSQVQTVNEASCQTKWSFLASEYNLEVDSLGQAIRNKPYATGLAGSCIYPYPELFENPKVISYSDIHVGSRVKLFGRTGFPTATDVYNRADRWEATVTSLKVRASLDSGWDLCSSEDPQYIAGNLAADQAGWTQTAADEFSFSGSGLITWGIHSNLSDYGSSNIYVYVCGPDPLTPSGLGYKEIGSPYLPVRLSEVSIAP